MKKLTYILAMCSMIMLTACDPFDFTPEGDKTKLWYAGEDGSDPVGGFINEDGKMVIPTKYYLNYFDFLFDQWAYFPAFSCGWARVYTVEDGSWIYAYIDKDGKEGRDVSDYDWCSDFYHNYAIVDNYVDGTYSEGVIDVDLKEVIPVEYYYLSYASEEGLFCFQEKKGDPYGYLDAKGKVVIDADFDDAWGFRNGMAKVELEKGEEEYLYGIIDTKGNYLIEPQKKNLNNIGEGLIAFHGTSGKWGIWDKKGSEVVSATYDEIWGFTGKGMSVVIKNNKYGYINAKGELAINTSYDNARPFYDDYTWVVKNDKWEAINMKGESLLKLKDNEVPMSDFHNGLTLVANFDNYTYRYINIEGKTVYKWTYDLSNLEIEPLAPQRRTAPLTKAEREEQELRAAQGTPYYSIVMERLGRKDHNHRR